MKTLILAAVAATVALSSTAEAQSLAVRNKQQQVEKALEYAASDMPRHCGEALQTGVDWSTFSEADYAERRAINGFCDGAISALRQICQGEGGAPSVQAKIDRLVCARGAGPSAELRPDGTYYYTFSFEDSNIYYWHLDFLRNNL